MRRLIDHLILKRDHFPLQLVWRIITPIYKSWNKNNPSNYRGICLSSCLGKLFTSILNNRLKKHVPQQNILHSVQNRFRTKPSHLWYNHTTNFNYQVCIKYLNTPKGKLFTCCIDLKIKKAFDSLSSWWSWSFLQTLTI